MMLTGLLDAGKLPSVQPFSGNPWLYTGIEDVSSASANGFYPNTVDWVLVELRDANDVTTVIASAAALLLADGQIVDVYDTTANGVVFNVPTDVPYYIAVKSRNHLATVSAEPVMIGTPYDFSTAVTQAMGENQLKILSSGGYAQYAGDINGNGIINYKDFNAYLLQITNTTYKSADINMDGQVNLVDFNWYLGNASTIGVTAIRY